MGTGDVAHCSWEYKAENFLSSRVQGHSRQYSKPPTQKNEQNMLL